MFDIRGLLAGIGILFFGMETFESTIKKLSGHKLKTIVQDFTNTTFKSIFSGTLITGITQNSGIVSLLVLAFVSAGVMQLHNAIGVILGANLGGTLDSLVIAYIGFGDYSISALGLPCISVGWLLLLIFRGEKVRSVGKMLIGFGLIFVGLGYMKESVEHLKTVVDLSAYKDISLLWFFLLGTLLTVALQSSSAMILLGLTALSSQIITFPAMCVIIIGANIGTTSTALLVSLGGKSVKKQVARSHTIFNVTLALLSIFLLERYMRLVLDVFKLSNNPVFGAAFFNFIYKLSGVIIFAPFLKQYARLLKRIIPDDKSSLPLQIEQLALKQNTDPALVGPQLIALRNDCRRIIRKTFSYNVYVYCIDRDLMRRPGVTFDEIKQHPVVRSEEHQKEIYEQLQKAGDIMLEHLFPIKHLTLSTEDVAQITIIEDIITNCMQSAKNIKNISHDIIALREINSELTRGIYSSLYNHTINFYMHIAHLTEGHTETLETAMAELNKTYDEIQKYHDDFMMIISKQIAGKFVEEIHIPTMININTYAHQSFTLMMNAVETAFIDSDQDPKR